MIFNMLDIVSYKPYLTIFEKDRFKTLFGKVLGTFTILSIFVLCTYFTITTFLKSEVSVIYNVSQNSKPVNLSTSPLMILLTDGLGSPIDDKFQEVRINFWNYTSVEGSNYSSYQVYEIPLEPCQNSSFGEFAPLFSSYLKQFPGSKCIPFQKYNLTLYGTWGSPNHHSFINIVVNMCNNRTTNNTCPDESVIEPVLKNVYLQMLYVDKFIDNYNYDNPIQAILKSESFPINWDIASRYFYQFKSLSYETDVGTVFEDKRKSSTYQFSNYVQNVQIRHGSSLYPGLTIGTVTLHRQIQGDQYYRSYPKLQTLLARIGGVIQAVMMVSQTLSHVITKNMFLVHMINAYFTFDLDEPDSNKSLTKKILVKVLK